MEELDNKVLTIRRSDLIVSTIMILGGLWFAYDSFKMSYLTIKAGHATIATSPGLFPFIISVLIILCSISVLLNAIRSGASLTFLTPSFLKRWAANFENWIPLVVMCYFVVFVFILIGRIPFIFATLSFGMAMMLTFRATRVIWIVVINVVYSTFVIYCFSNFAYTKFPMSLF